MNEEEKPEDQEPIKLTPQQKLRAIQGLDPYADDDSGLSCPQCGCKDLRVRNTINDSEGVRRYRVCRHCGTSRRTRENFG